MPARCRTRPGFALAIALAAIVIIGAIITGMFFASTQEYRMSRNTALQARALTSSEFGMNSILTVGPGNWDPAWNTAANGLVGTKSYTTNDGWTDTVRVTKTGDAMFLLTSTGRVGPASGAQSRHRVGAIVTLLIPQLKMIGALTTQGQVKLGGTAFLSGKDSTVDNWNCPPAGTGVPGLAMPDTTSSKLTAIGNCAGLACIDGSPKVVQDTAAGSASTYFSFGPGLDWDALTDMATKTYSSGANLNGLGPSVTGGVCYTADQSNWGDPKHTTSQCQSYFPIIHALGDLKITGGVGQGILLVEGDLSVQGGAEFFGPVIVRGSLKSSGTGGHFNGGVMAANVDLEQSSLLGNAVVNFSSCALTKALAGAATPVFVARRSWTELY
jgi:hypothetical protein